MNSPDSQFKPHPFYCPIEPVMHPKVAEIEQQAIAWLDKFGLTTEAALASRSGFNATEFFGRITPNASEENLLLFSQWTYWGFFFDDTHSNAAKLSATHMGKFLALPLFVQHILEQPYAPLVNNEPFLAALQDISQRCHNCATSAQMQRFIYAHSLYLLGCAWKSGNQFHNYIPSVNDYLILRLYSAGTIVMAVSLEILNGKEISTEEINSPIVTAVTKISMLVAALDNDLISYRKEVNEGQGTQNIIKVLMYHNHCTLEQAMSDALTIRDRLMHLFLCLREQILPQASQELRSYLISLGNTIRGTFDWELNSARYKSIGDSSTPPFYPEAFTPEWTDKPDIYTTPLPLPAISWWWDYLNPTQVPDTAVSD